MQCRRSPIAPAAVALAIMLMYGSLTPASAQGSGPDRWAVTGVSTGKTLTVREQPSQSAEPVGTIPHDARGLANLGCRGDPDKQAAQRRWCRIRYKGIEGWVAGRFLKEDAGPQAAVPVPLPTPAPTAAPTSEPTTPPPPAQAAAPAPPATAPPAPTTVPAPAPAAAPKAPANPSASTLVFTCTAAGAIVVMVDKDGTVTNQNYPPRDTMRLTVSVKPSAPESAGPVATATIWQMLGQQGERFEGTLAWGKAVDAREGHWRLDLQNKTLRMVQPQEGTAARFFRFDCQ